MSGDKVVVDKVSHHQAWKHLILKSIWSAILLRTFQTYPFYLWYWCCAGMNNYLIFPENYELVINEIGLCSIIHSLKEGYPHLR